MRPSASRRRASASRPATPSQRASAMHSSNTSSGDCARQRVARVERLDLRQALIRRGDAQAEALGQEGARRMG
jgi:hypothetical protein